MVKNVESIHHWPWANAISCNLSPSKIQIYFPRFGSSGRRYIYTILTQMNNQIFASLTLQETKLSGFCNLRNFAKISPKFRLVLCSF